MSIILLRLGPSTWSYGTSLACAKHCRLDPSTTQHGAYVDDEGVFHYQHIDATSGTTTTLLRFQLQYSAAEGLTYEPINKPWTFEFVPGSPGDLLLVQEGSCRILYASLPKQGADSSDVFLFGSHTAPVCCLSTNGNVVFSGCQGGVLKLWRMSDGQLADTCALPDKAAITAIASLGPLLVAVGSSSSTVTLYDISSGRLLAVQRLMSGPGAVQSMAAWVPPEVLAGANLAPGGPLPPDGGGVLPGGSWSALRQSTDQDATGSGARALLAVASSSGWLCVFSTNQLSNQPWSLIHTTGSLIAPGVEAQLAFSPDGTSLAVASPAAQLLGADAIALASMGASPGAVSLYKVSISGMGLSALLPPLLQQQQQGQREQLPELLLWHQWSVSSTPAGLWMLPSSGFGLMHGKQLQPAQVLHLYVVPQIGPAQVLKAQHKPPAPVYSPKQQPTQQPTAIAYAAMAGRQLLEAAAAAAAAGSAVVEPAPGLLRSVDGKDQIQQQQWDGSSPRAPVPGGSSSSGRGGRASSTSSSIRRQEEADEALLLNIAERDLAEVAHAIAAAAGPTLDAELVALLAGASAAAAGGANWGGDGSATAETAGTSGPADDITVSSQQQQQQLPQQEEDDGEGRTGTRGPAAAPGASAAAPSTVDGSEADAAAGGGLRLPRTLPGVRSWRARLGPASQQEGPTDLSALTQSLHEEQEQLRQQQQQQQQQQAREAQLSSAAALAGTDSAGGVGAEPELPSESSFQHMLQPEQGSQAPQQQQQQQQRSHLQPLSPPRQQQQPQELLQMSKQEEPGSSWGATGTADAAAEATAVTAAAAAAEVCAASAAAAAAAAAAAVAVRDTSARALPAGAEHEPQPRQLPAMLRGSSSMQRAPAAATQDTSSAAGVIGVEGSRGVAGLAHGHSRTAVAAGGVDMGQTIRQQQITAGRQLEEVPASAATGRQQQQQAPQGLQQQQQQQAQMEQQQGAAQQPAGRLTVLERLNLRRREVLAKQQAQQAQRVAAAMPAAVRGASSSAQVVRAGQGGGAGAFAPASDHPLAVAVQNSSRLLAAKLQEAERARDVVVDPAGPAAIKLAAARLADLDLSPEEQQYCYEELPDLKDVATPTHAQKLVPKQLDAHWVASRSLKPCMDTLFKPQEWQQTFVDPQVLLLPAWPSPQQVVEQLLWPGQRPGVWT